MYICVYCPNMVTPASEPLSSTNKHLYTFPLPAALIKSPASIKFISQQSRGKVWTFVFKALFTPNRPSSPSGLGPKSFISEMRLGGQMCEGDCATESESFMVMCLSTLVYHTVHVHMCLIACLNTSWPTAVAVVWLTSPLKMLVGRWLLHYLFCFTQSPM